MTLLDLQYCTVHVLELYLPLPSKGSMAEVQWPTSNGSRAMAEVQWQKCNGRLFCNGGDSKAVHCHVTQYSNQGGG